MQTVKKSTLLSLAYLTLLTYTLSFQVVLGEDAENAPKDSIEYLALDPKFIVNLKSRRTYLRADIQLMIQGANHLKTVETHVPAIRHALIMLFSDYSREQLNQVDTRDELRNEALNTVKQTLDKYASSDGVKDLFFTEFLVQ